MAEARPMIVFRPYPAVLSPAMKLSSAAASTPPIAEQTREEASQVDNPRARALFETTAEVLHGLASVYEDFEARTEQAWQET
jgi:hypothetical protein